MFAHGSTQNLLLLAQARSDFFFIAKRNVKLLITLGKQVLNSSADGDYEILPNADLRLEAGETIHFTDGFHAHAGSEMHALIFYEYCEGYDLRKGNLSETSTQQNDLKLNEKFNETTTNKEDNVLLFPNPSANNLTIYSDEKIDQVKIYNISGLEVNAFQLSSDENRYFISHTFLRGSYLLHLKKGEERIVKQFVVL